jgi:hypothetical protein
MAQSMNGLSSISNAGLNEESNLSVNNLSCNNVSCNNVSCNGILTDTLTVLQTNGTTANYTGVVNSNKYTGDKIQIADISSNNLFSTFIQSTDISCNKFNCDNITNIRENCGLLLTPTSVENILIGVSSGNYMSGGCNYNIGIGHQCYDSQVVSESNGNIAIGFKSGLNMSGGSNNIYLGNLTGEQETDTNVYNNSCCIGNNSFISASNTIFLGTSSESVVVRGDLECDSTVFCDTLVLRNISGSRIFDIEILTNLEYLTTNVQQFCDKILKDSLFSLTTGINNLILGFSSGSGINTGSYNVGAGYEALNNVTSGYSNIGIGKYGGQNLVEESDCICIGVESGKDANISNTLQNSVAIGSYSKFDSSNQISLGTVYHTVKIDGKLEGPNIISKSNMKYGKHQATGNNFTTVVFSTPFPVGSLPFVQLTPVYIGNATASGFLYVYDYSHTSLTYGYLLNGAHSEISIIVNWMAMIP